MKGQIAKFYPILQTESPSFAGSGGADPIKTGPFGAIRYSLQSEASQTPVRRLKDFDGYSVFSKIDRRISRRYAVRKSVMSKRSHWGLLLCVLAVLSVVTLPPANLPDIGSNEMNISATLGYPALLRSTTISPHTQARAIAERHLVSVSTTKRGTPGWQLQARAPHRASFQELLCTFLN